MNNSNQSQSEQTQILNELKINKMKNLSIKNSNQSQQEPMLNKNQNLVIVVDKFLLDIVTDTIIDELKYMRESSDDNEDITEFLCEDYYYTESPLLKKIESVREELYSDNH